MEQNDNTSQTLKRFGQISTNINTGTDLQCQDFIFFKFSLESTSDYNLLVKKSIHDIF